MTNAFRRFMVLICAGTCAAAAVRAGETTDGKAVTTTEETPEYKNWIELGSGGVITSGDRAQFEEHIGCQVVSLTAASRIYILRGLWARTACFRWTATLSGISTITTYGAIVEAKARLYQSRFY